jgi:O-antigen ligase/Flp pilus assembly protein TadD
MKIAAKFQTFSSAAPRRESIAAPIAPNSRSGVWCDRIVVAGIALLIIFTPLAFGSVHPWAYSLMEACVFLLFAAWMIKLIVSPNSEKDKERERDWFAANAAAMPFALFLFLIVFQLVPLPPALLRAVSPHTFEYYAHAIPLTSDLRPPTSGLWLPLSLAPDLTRSGLLKLMAYGALFFLILLYPLAERTPSAKFNLFAFVSQNPTMIPAGTLSGASSGEGRFLRRLLFTVLFTGLSIAIIAFVQRLTWNGKILWFFVPYDWGVPFLSGIPRASGPFVNPDHFANYIALILPLTIAAALGALPGISLAQNRGAQIFFGVSVLILCSTLLLSLSRSAWLSTLAALAIFAWAGCRDCAPGSRFINNRRVLVAAVALAVVLGAALFFIGSGGRHQVDTRLAETVHRDIGLVGRAAIWRDTLPMIRDFSLFGVGLGVWPELYLRYRQPPWMPDFYRTAHNDYLQVLAETGIVGIALLGWCFAGLARALLRSLKESSPRFIPSILGIFAGCAAMAVHEGLDGNLQVPANAVMFVVLLALGLRAAGAVSNRKGSRLPAFVRKFSAPVFAALGMTLAACALVQDQTPYPYGNPAGGAAVAENQTIVNHPTRASLHVSSLRTNARAPERQLAAAEAALWIEPTNPYLRDLLASLLFTSGQKEKALSEIARSVADSPVFETHVYLNDKVLARLPEAEREAVEKGFREASAGGQRQAARNLAAFYGKTQRFSEQGILYENIAAAETGEAAINELLLDAGQAYVNGGMRDDAERVLRRAIGEAPKDRRAYEQLAAAIYARDGFGAAEDIVATGIKNGAPGSFLFLALAGAAEKAGRLEDSRRALSRAKQEIEAANPAAMDAFDLYLSLAEASRLAGDRAGRVAALEKALEAKPESLEVLSALGNLYLEQRNFARASLCFAGIAQLKPESAPARFQLGLAEEARYRLGPARKAYAYAVELDPGNRVYRQHYEAVQQRIESAKNILTRGQLDN